jgi:ACT domain-containing protein
MKFIVFLFLILLVKTENNVSWKLNKVDSNIINVVWCASNRVVTEDQSIIELDIDDDESQKKIVYALTNKGVIYKSINNGGSYYNTSKNLETKFHQLIAI